MTNPMVQVSQAAVGANAVQAGFVPPKIASLDNFFNLITLGDATNGEVLTPDKLTTMVKDASILNLLPQIIMRELKNPSNIKITTANGRIYISPEGFRELVNKAQKINAPATYTTKEVVARDMAQKPVAGSTADPRNILPVAPPQVSREFKEAYVRKDSKPVGGTVAGETKETRTEISAIGTAKLLKELGYLNSNQLNCIVEALKA